MKEEFYAAIKLVSGEEIFAQVTPSEEEDRTLLILDTPVVFETIQLKHMAVSAIKVEPWMTMGDESMMIINMDKVITITEVKDEQVLCIYNKYLRDKDRETNQTKIKEEMGFLSTISKARVSLEKLYKSSLAIPMNPDRVILQRFHRVVKPFDYVV